MRHEGHAATLQRREIIDQQELLRAPRVLLAEDDGEFRKLLAGILRKNGFDVIEAKDGADLIATIEALSTEPSAAQPDVIVSDIRMPGYTGLDVLWGLRKGNCAIPVILMTAFGTDETRVEALRLGADTIISKPLNPETLVTMVRSFSSAGA